MTAQEKDELIENGAFEVWSLPKGKNFRFPNDENTWVFRGTQGVNGTGRAHCELASNASIFNYFPRTTLVFPID